jgi:hypothetical protein
MCVRRAIALGRGGGAVGTGCWYDDFTSVTCNTLMSVLSVSCTYRDTIYMYVYIQILYVCHLVHTDTTCG